MSNKQTAEEMNEEPTYEDGIIDFIDHEILERFEEWLGDDATTARIKLKHLKNHIQKTRLELEQVKRENQILTKQKTHEEWVAKVRSCKHYFDYNKPCIPRCPYCGVSSDDAHKY